MDSVITITIDTRLNMERFLSVKGNTSILLLATMKEMKKYQV